MQPRRALISIVAVLVFAQVLIFSPRSLDQPPSPQALVNPEEVTPSKDATLANGIPSDQIPDYTVEKFSYVSSQGGQKQWKLLAVTSHLYQTQKLVHGKTVKAELYDSNGRITHVTGKEAKYFTHQRDLEIFGDVVTIFPDGFTTRSEYMRYRPVEKRVDIPTKYFVQGNGVEENGQKLNFTSLGIEYQMGQGEVTLLQSAKVSLIKRPPPSLELDDTKGVPEVTTILSDRCVIERHKQLAHFTMSRTRPLAQRFVKIEQPTLYSQSRKADLIYGNLGQVLRYLVATEDVLIRELDQENPTMKYATAGRAEFDTQTDVIVLKEYPQVYQDKDTVTGDVVIMHRDSDIIEVENANAYSEGTQQ